MDETVRPVPIMQPCCGVNLFRTIGRFMVLFISESYLASVTYPKHYVAIATVYVANKNVAELKTPTPDNGA